MEKCPGVAYASESVVRGFTPPTRLGRRSIVGFVGALCVGLLTTLPVIAQEPAIENRDEERLHEPVGVAWIAGIDRWVDDVEYVFETADRMMFVQTLRAGLVALNDLEGIDGSRPVGLSLYLDVGDSPNGDSPKNEPIPVAFIPVTDIEQAIKSIRMSGAVTIEAGTQEGAYTLRANDVDVPIQVRDGYAYITRHRADFAGRMHPPQALLAEPMEKYDAGLLFNNRALPRALVDDVLSGIRADVEQDLKQKPGESDAELRGRRAGAELFVDAIERLLKDGDQLRVGWTLSRKDQRALLEVELTAGEQTQLAEGLKRFGEISSRFAGRLDPSAPLSLSTAWHVPPRVESLLRVVYEEARKDVAAKLQRPSLAREREAAAQVFDAIGATLKEGRVDAFLQFVGDPPGKFVLVAGLGLSRADQVAGALPVLLPHARDSKNVASLEVNALTSSGVTFHRIHKQKFRKQDRQLYGEDAAFYVGAGQDAIWFAFGGPQTVDVIGRAIERMSGQALARPGDQQSEADGPASSRPSSLQLTVKPSSWVELARSVGDVKEEDEFAQLLAMAFISPDDDRLQIDVRPTDAGLLMQIELGEGYVRLLGLAIEQQSKQ